jgi:glycosyltransferase involved in cell wall biosynthesis
MSDGHTPATPLPDPRAPAPLPAGVSAVVPVYNGEQTLGELVTRLEPVLKDGPAAGGFELILVNDASRDRSWDVIRDLSARHPWVTGIDLMRNYGQHNALLCGVRAARFDMVVTLDDDLQNPPEEIPKLLAKLADGFDVVYGPPERQQHGLLRGLASSITKLVLQGAMGAETARNISAFRAFRTSLRGAFDHYRSPLVNLDVLLTWATTRFVAVKVRHEARRHGVSNYTVGKLVLHALNMATGFSTWPLRLASYGGFAFTLLGVAVFVFVVARYLAQGTPVQGFPFLASIIAIFSGAQLFALGVIGEYLARVHLRGMERPTYAVRSQTGRTQP